MLPTDAIDRMRQAADALDMEVSEKDLLGRMTLVARRSDFKIRWFATRLHTFVVASAFEAPASVADLDAFLDAARQFAIEHKGGLPRGLQTGSAAVAVAVVPSHEQSAESWALNPHGGRYAALAYPVMADIGSGIVLEPSRLVLGFIYAKHLRGVVNDVVRQALIT